MSKKLIGMLAGVALFGSGAAFAGDDQHKQDQQAQQSQTQDAADTTDSMGTATDSEQGIGGSGQEGEDALDTTGMSSETSGTSDTTETTTEATTESGTEAGIGGSGQEQAQAKELTGKVVWAQGQKVYVDHMGAVVELRTDSQTEFSGDARRVNDLREGDEIRASFEVDKGIRNKATSIEKTSGTGGSGFEDVGSSTEGGLDNTGSESGQGGSGLEGGASETEPATETPPADSTLPGTGGSGTEGLGNEAETPDTMGTEPSQSLPEQTGSESDVDSSATDSSTQIQ